jgi:nitrite reductase/ring-hydroxylating ferredoxin subunit/uncharacterized membrane protein
MKQRHLRSDLAGLLPDPAGPGRVLALMGRLERAEGLDRVAGPLRRAVRAVPLGRGRDALHGRWLGHPVHPLLVQVPIGAWLSSAVLDLVPGARRPSALLVGVGLAGAGPAALAGWADWAELEEEQARVGLAHAALNTVAVSCYAGSLAMRLAGRHRRGRLLALAGLTTASLSGALGGHLAYRQAAGVNHAEAAARLVAPGWHGIGPMAELPVGQPVRRLVGDTGIVVLREADDTLYALADRCSHLAGPLSEGEVVDGCLVCPWHGSTFRLTDGWNLTGPATAPQPVFDTRVSGGEVQVRVRTGPDGDA